MIDHSERVLGPAGYDFGDAHKLPENLENKELFNQPSWHIAMEILRGSFVISSGRQYAQLCDMAVAAALIDEQHIPFDRTILTAQDATDAIRAWKLPPSHTGKPTHTDDLVKGGHEFWWRMLGDTFAWRFEGAELLPNERAIIERFRECKVPFGQTSSTTTEEIASLDRAIDDLRSAQGETSNELAMRSLKWHLRAGLHWLSHKRPRTDRGGDKHEVRWRTGMLAASAKPESRRNIYDQVLVKEAEMIDVLLSMPHDMLIAHGLEDTYELYDEVLNVYNAVHHEQLNTLHRYEPFEAQSEPVRPAATALGAAGLMSASTAE